MPEQQANTPTEPTTFSEFTTQFAAKKQELINDMNSEDSALRRTLNANGIFRASDMKYNEAFYRFSRLPLVIDSEATSAKGFLTEPAKIIPYFTDLAESEGYRKSVFCNLSYSGSKEHDGCPFIRILSNRKTSNMDIPDIQVEELETAANLYGTKIIYPKGSGSNDEGIDFTVEFEDTRFLEIYHLFKVWDYYRSLKWYGVISPASFLKEYGANKKQRASDGLLEAAANHVEGAMDLIRQSFMDPDQSYGKVERDYVGYIFHKVLHDHIRVFKFLIDNDGESILYAASAIGCYPKTIQRSSFSEIPDRGPLKISIGFKVSGWFDDILTNVVRDFKAIVNSWKSQSECEENYHPLYDPEIGYISQELVDVPFISERVAWGEGRASQFSRYIFGWAKTKTSGARASTYVPTNYTSPESARELKGDTNEPLTDIKAPNGKYVTQNDWDYLKDYDDEARKNMLFNDPKYRAVSTTEESSTPQQEEPTTNQPSSPSTVTWNGAPVIPQGQVITGYGYIPKNN